MGKRKSARQKAQGDQRYAWAYSARTDADFEPFYTDPTKRSAMRRR